MLKIHRPFLPRDDGGFKQLHGPQDKVEEKGQLEPADGPVGFTNLGCGPRAPCKGGNKRCRLGFPTKNAIINSGGPSYWGAQITSLFEQSHFQKGSDLLKTPWVM